MNAPSPNQQWHTIVTTVENKPGVLARVASLFSRRNYNIHSLAVAPTDDERFSRITFTVDVEGTPLDQVVKQLNKLINVVAIQELNPADSVERELMLITVNIGTRHKDLMEIVDDYRAHVLSEGNDRIMLSWSARPARLDELEERLRPFGIVELQRTGRVALPSLDN
ncbi:MAG: acetolactate synthase small subunit [Acidimicrobiaceae bacterium]|jgi:acetolactate synthase I/III small subunit|nr:acetolactate synthase small subunit [Acidimicrobiaceae bacterium]MBT5581628.1 acetolactate synthase small subunit [Acidimicrobiaceae bacterium]MBT5849076.1 acetolactate synthase small subunit [Acidimicrobiaceae bacterium]MDG1410397.1 acetolactate synthase small subunit [Acidimicrobiales bacterium]MDG2217999.1 acetolactate synthase small subunit [Acidimicrobiales bacterium]